MNKLFSYSFITIIIITIIVSLFSSLSPSLFDYSSFGINQKDIIISENGYTWPVPR